MLSLDKFPALAKLLHAGADTQNKELNKRVHTTNVISVLTGSLSFFIGIFLFVLSGSRLILYPALVETALFGTVILLNYLRQYFMAGLFSHITQCMATICFGVLLGRIVDAQLMAVFLVGTPLLLFRERNIRILCILFSCITMVLLELNAHYHVVEPIPINTSLQVLFRSLSIAVILFLNGIVLFYYERNSRSLLQQVQRSNKDLEKVSASKSVYVRETTHELRAPLNAIHSVSQFLHNGEYVPADLPRYHRSLYHSSHLALEIINNVLELASIESGKVHALVVRKINIREWLHNATEIFAQHAAFKQVDVLATVDDDVPEQINFDPVKVTQILNNLLNNAIKFSFPLGKVTVHISGAAGGWMLSVRDQGMGMDQEQVKHIFDPFFTTRQSNAYGTGLGLHIAQNLANMLKGQIAVESEPGNGTVFRVTLPYLEDPAPAINEPGPAHFPIPEGVSVLVIDDDRMSTELLCKYLSSIGIRPITAATGEEGYQLAVSEKPELVLLDMELPDQPGMELLARFKAQPVLRHIPVIFVSGSAFAEDQEAAMQQGAAGFLTKPVYFPKVRAIISGALSLVGN
ncbi:ATP-binding response regulator [Chitinophaga alhagiae]|uniref:ATP-binding response regulator n=1 Tax=Chitinophaga alhagiae TaxID=2203219 RepID=UPI000E5C27F6|nr:hybrid sensor histidine kinase/response regulator [Chitinophaga alhagiae]